MFWFKRKKIIVDCFTPSKSVYDNAPVLESANFFPSWWKTVPKDYIATNEMGIPISCSTIRRCNGILDLYTSGIVLPLWSDLIIEKDDKSYRFQYSNNGLGEKYIQDIVTHNSKQLSKDFENYHHIKIIPPWAFKEKTGIKFYFSNPFWNNVDKWEHITVVPGFVEFKLAKHPNVNCFLSKKYKNLFFKYNTPLVQMLPMTEKEIEIRRHLVDDKEYRDLIEETGYTISFKNKYRNLVKIKNAKDKKKCPFS